MWIAGDQGAGTAGFQAVHCGALAAQKIPPIPIPSLACPAPVSLALGWRYGLGLCGVPFRQMRDPMASPKGGYGFKDLSERS